MPNFDHLDIILDPALNPANLLPDDLREALVAKLKELAERESPDLSFNEFCAFTGIEPSTVRRKFPRWSEFRKAAGLTAHPKRRTWGSYDTGQMLDAFLEFVAEEGERVTLNGFSRRIGVAPATVVWHFGSFGDLRRRAGLQSKPPGRKIYTDDEILEYYHQVVEKLGRIPTLAEFDRLAPISPNTLVARIGKKSEVARRYQEYLGMRERANPDERAT